ncbi:MAG: hypothetical protein KAT77_01035 [Nanoarchaeota archaeon]|nr:hypothetical protein [Nanoarchaeota archaeon]
MEETKAEKKKIEQEETTEKERLEQERLGLALYGVHLDYEGFCLLEESLLKYFTNNEKRVLEIQHYYQEKGKGIDLVTATELALRQDIFGSKRENENNLHGLVHTLQYAVAVRRARQKNPDGDVTNQMIFKETFNVSDSFGPKYLKYMSLVELVMERYARVFQNEFQKIVDEKAA